MSSRTRTHKPPAEVSPGESHLTVPTVAVVLR